MEPDQPVSRTRPPSALSTRSTVSDWDYNMAAEAILTSYEECEFLNREDVEHWTHLKVIIGQELRMLRYHIVRKLGAGSYSTVWLARDQKYDRFVTIKILSAEETAKQVESVCTEELTLARRLIRNPGTHPHLPRYFEIFEEKDWHRIRSHACFVMEPLSCLQHWIDRAGNGLPPHAYKKLARQVLQALRFLHEEWKLIYVDLKPDNVCVRTNHMESVIRHEMVANPPTVAEMGRDALGRDNVLPAGVIPYFSQSLPAWLDEADEVVQDDITAVLIDLGKVRSRDLEHNDKVQTTAYRSPEVILEHPWGSAVDIWAFGCLLFEMATGGPLHPNPLDDWGYQLYLYAGFAGPNFPLTMKEKSQDRDEYLDDEGQLPWDQVDTETYSDQLERRTEGRMQAAERDELARFLERCFVLDPALRPTASELLQDPYFQ